MKYHSKRTIFVSCLAALLFNVCLAEDVEYVQVKTAAVKAQPKVLSHVITTLSYGDKVTIIGEQDQWKLAKIGDKQGYLHASALGSAQLSFQRIRALPITLNKALISTSRPSG